MLIRFEVGSRLPRSQSSVILPQSRMAHVVPIHYGIRTEPQNQLFKKGGDLLASEDAD
jgi:hypothetical protein